MSGNVVPMNPAGAPEPQPEPHAMTIGERLRSTMAAEYAAPFLTELNRLQGVADAAVAQGEAARRLAASLAARVAAEHRLRLDAEAETSAVHERMERLMRAFAYVPPPPARRPVRLRRAWRALRTP